MTRSIFSIQPNKQNVEFMQTIENKNSFFNQLINLIREDQIKIIIENSPHETKISLIEKEDETIESKIKRQQLLKLQLSNWKDLKLNGMTLDESQAILRGEIPLKEPTLSYNVQLQLIDTFSMCSECKHEHASDYPRVCKDFDCNCGVRG